MEVNNMTNDGLRSNKLPEIPSLTGLRFFAAIFVCVAHTITYVVPGLPPTISRLAAEGMTLFFVLSGFVIHYNYSNSIFENPFLGIYNFFVSRFARLYPLFIFCLGLDLIKNYGYSTLPAMMNQAIPYYLTLTQSWFYIPMGGSSLIYQFGLMPSVSWSVSTEWFFYLAYPLICFMLVKARKIGTKLSMLSVIFMAMPVFIALIYHFQSAINDFAVNAFGPVADQANHQDSFSRWLIYFSPYSRISEFLVGCLTAAIYMQVSHRQPSRREERYGLIALSAALISVPICHHYIFNPPQFSFLSWIPTLHQCFGFAPSVSVIIFCCARYHNFITRFFCNPTILMGGEISYSIYLLHLPIAEAFSRDAAPVTLLKVLLADSSRFLIAIVAILGAAMITYRFVEVPSRRILRKSLVINDRKLDVISPVVT